MVVVVDPYEYFNLSSVVSREDKERISYKLNYALWKLIHYRRDPKPNILLGDSRMNQLPVNKIQKLTGQHYANLAYGSGTLDEICSTFWVAASVNSIQNVYIGLNLNLYNSYNSKNRVPGAKAIIENPFLYIINRDVLKAAYLLVKERIAQNENKGSINIERPDMTREEFWRYQLDTTTTRYYGNYGRPVMLLKELQKISQYCAAKKINLVFLIFPTHEDLRAKVRSFGLESAAKQFRSDIMALGKVYDFDYTNDLTTKRVNFKDPYHLSEDKATELVDEIWDGKRKYSLIYNDNQNNK